MWGTSRRQRLRLSPLFAAMVAADRVAALMPDRAASSQPHWQPGISVLVPDRDAPAMLAQALQAIDAALAHVHEPRQVIVAANGALRTAYDDVRARFPHVEWVHDDNALGFAGAVERGLAAVRYDGTYLVNNDMTLEPAALTSVLALRAPDVFAIGSQILQQDATGRREETGFTDWYVDSGGVRLYHAPVPSPSSAAPHLCASGGAALFRTSLLRRYLPASRAYDPFYWEDVEWSLRAWRDGYRVLFCPESRARHRHRATTARFYERGELERIVERNRLLFDARHGVTDFGPAWLMQRICEQPYATQRELSSLAHARGVFAQRVARRRAPQPTLPPRLGGALASSFSFRLRPPDAAKRRVLFVTPFAVFPPRHGGARRVGELVRGLRVDCDVALVTDEASLYDARSFADFDGLCAVHVVQRDEGPAQVAEAADPGVRMREHCHRPLVDALAAAVRDWRPDVVQVEHAELAPLVRQRAGTSRWVLGLHDAWRAADFAHAEDAARFALDLAAFDALTVCSPEDLALVAHPHAVCIGNGANIALADYRPSEGAGILFVGPFRYRPNRDGIVRFLREAWPAVRAAAPSATLTILGGDEHAALAAGETAFAQPGVEVLGHRDDVPRLLAACALTINPLSGIRGSAVKLVESLVAGRVCVSTADGARGFTASSPALVVVPDAAAMAAPIVDLLVDAERRRRLEAPDRDALAPFGWPRAVAQQRALYEELLRSGG
ncbi:MAG: glycosyltransferase [Burkholderiales bacterium]